MRLSIWTWVLLTGAVAAETPGLDPGWRAEIERGIREREYHARLQDGGWQAANRAQGLRSHFAPTGIRVTRRSESMSPWEWRLSLAGFGRGEHIEPVERADIRADGNRIEYQRGDILEWYVNRSDGLEQGFDLHARPDGVDQPAEVVLELGGDLSPNIADDGQAIDFHAPGGALAIRYDKLVVTDSSGQRLDARMKADLREGKRRIRILFDDTDAVYPVVVDPLATSPAWTAEPDQASARLGFAVATAGDVNGDGFSDLLVGAYTFDGGETDEGAAFVYLGSASGPATTPVWTGEGNQATASYGVAVSTAGDVNGDGYADILVGAHLYDARQIDGGRAYVYLGSPSGPSPTAVWSPSGGQASEFFGRGLGTAGDVDGDGYSDIVIGSTGYDGLGVDQGRAYLYRGSSSGPSTSPDWIADGDAQAGANYGLALGLAGDVNGDGFGDLFVTAYAHDDGEANEGRLFVYHGSASGPSATPDWQAQSDQAEARLGYHASTAGDVNGDGYADLIAGAYLTDNGQTDEGRAYVYFGSAIGLSGGPVAGPGDADWLYESDQAGARLGIAVSTAGDVNGDGFADVVVGADRFDNGSGDEGRIFLFLGSSTGPSTAPDWTAESDQGAANLGRAVSTAGDVNGDGYSDILAGAPLFNNGEINEGRVYLYLGASDGIGANPGSEFIGSLPESYLGYAVSSAGDVNGDGLADLLVGAWGEDPVAQDEGRAYLYLGAEGGVSTTPAWSYAGSQLQEYVGTALASAGDVNGDGYGDVVLGVGWYDNGSLQDEGRALVFHGSSDGLSLTPDMTLECGNGGQFRYCGFSVAGAGDVNGDGFGDVIVGAPAYSNQFYGAAYVFHGSATGLSAIADWLSVSPRDQEHFGHDVSSAGDINGDGFSDVVISTDVIADTGFTFNKAATVFQGGLNGLALGGSDLGVVEYYYGKEDIDVAAAGDVNGDGYADILVGEPRDDAPGASEAGRVSLYLGSPSGVGDPPDWVFTGVDPYDRVGWSVDGAGDVNGDGYADIVVGEPSHTGPDPIKSGSVHVFHGSAAGPGVAPDETLSISQIGAFFGSSVAGVGDTDGDGYSDIVAGAAYFDDVPTLGASDEGRVAVHHGNGTPGVALRPMQLRTDGITPVAPHGWSDSGTGFRILTTGRTPFGRGRVKLEWEVKPFGTPFDGTDTSITPDWVDTEVVGAILDEVVDGLQQGDRVHWRVRLLYDPASSPYQGSSRWFTQPWNGAEELDLRVPAIADFDISVTDDLDPVLAGIEVTYSIQIGNSGPDDVAATVRGTLHSSVVSVTPSQGSCGPTVGSPPDLDCDLGVVASGGTASIQVVLSVYPGTRTVTVSVSADARDDDPSNDSASETTTANFLRIGDLVWNDLDGNGIRDAGEPGLAGALALLYRDDGTFLDSRLLPGSGSYSFSSVTLGESYYLRFIPPEGYALTAPDQGSDDLADSDADPVTLRTPTFTLVDPDDPVRWDAGMIPLCTTPDEPIFVYDMRLTGDGNDYPILDFQDPNQPSQITGYNVYRASDPGLSTDPASLYATDVIDMDEAAPNKQWIDTSGDVSPSGVWYYQVTAFNHRCPTGSDEGPF